MAERSFRQTLRRRIAPIAFLGALALLGVRTCGTEMARVDLRFELGSAAAEVRSFAVDVHRGEEVAPVAYQTAEFGVGGASETLPDWSLQLDPGQYVLKIRMATASGGVLVERRIEVSDRAVITIDLEDELRSER